VDPDRELRPWNWDGHLLLLHRSESERQSRLATWVRHGLDRGEKVIYTEAPPSRSVLAVLSGQGIDVRAATAAGHLEVLPTDEFCEADVVGQALADGFPAVRVSTEAGDALAGPGGFTTIEQVIERLCRVERVSALCQYDGRTVTGAALDDVAGRHAGGVRETQFETAASDDGLAIAGEIDFTNDEVLAATLRAATSSASGVFRVDLRHVTFVSAGGLRALANGTKAFREQGGDLVLVCPCPSVDRSLKLLAVDQLDHVTVDRNGIRGGTR
jgi:anti-anti-sigma factor